MSNVIVKPIKTAEDLDEAVKRIEALWGSKTGTPDGDELDVLMDLVHAYEERNNPRLPLHPLKVILSRMEDLGLKGKEVAIAMGVKAENFCAMLNGKRPLSLKSILPLSEVLQVPVELLIGPNPSEAFAHLEVTLRDGLLSTEDRAVVLNIIEFPKGLQVVGDRIIVDGGPGPVIAKTPADTHRILEAISLCSYSKNLRGLAA